jgi:hypothetical protein
LLSPKDCLIALSTKNLKLLSPINSLAFIDSILSLLMFQR